MSSVSALQWRSIYIEEFEIKTVNLNDAYDMCNDLVKVNTNLYGEKNMSTAKFYRLLGSLLYYMER